MARYSGVTTRIVDTGDSEPSAEVLRLKQEEILSKLRSVTVDQITDFQSRPIDVGLDEAKAAWEKTIWAK